MPNVVNPAWMQPVKMTRIIAHWSAGTHRATELDKEHYHIIVEADGTIVRGDHDIADKVSTTAMTTTRRTPAAATPARSAFRSPAC